MNLKVGQTYRIKIIFEKVSTEANHIIEKHAKLIQETEYFYTFEYKTKSGDLTRITIDKFDLKHNPSLIKEV